MLEFENPPGAEGGEMSDEAFEKWQAETASGNADAEKHPVSDARHSDEPGIGNIEGTLPTEEEAEKAT